MGARRQPLRQLDGYVVLQPKAFRQAGIELRDLRSVRSGDVLTARIGCQRCEERDIRLFADSHNVQRRAAGRCRVQRHGAADVARRATKLVSDAAAALGDQDDNLLGLRGRFRISNRVHNSRVERCPPTWRHAVHPRDQCRLVARWLHDLRHLGGDRHQRRFIGRPQRPDEL